MVSSSIAQEQSKWDKLKSPHKNRSQPQSTHLQRAFNNVMMEQGEDVDNYINRVANYMMNWTMEAQGSERPRCVLPLLRASHPPTSTSCIFLDNQTCTFTIESVRNSIIRFDAMESLGKGLLALTSRVWRPKTKTCCSFWKDCGHVAENHCTI